MSSTTNFNCSIPVLGQAGITLWNNCSSQQPAMFGMKSIYTSIYIQQQKSALASAMALPDADARMSVHEAIRINMVNKAKDNLRLWQGLKRHCVSAWSDDEAMLDTMLTQAGWSNYNAAAAFNWVSLQSLNNSAISFISNNLDYLKTNGYMNDLFPEQYSAMADEFNALYTDFIASQQSAKLSGGERNDLLNTCYSAIIMMCEDAQWLFSKNEALKEQFVFDKVCSMIAPDTGSTAVIEVVNDATNQPVTAQVENMESGRVMDTDTTGRAEMGHLPQGATRFTITAEGYTQQTVTQTMNGTRTIIRVRMDKIVAVTTTAPAEAPETIEQITN